MPVLVDERPLDGSILSGSAVIKLIQRPTRHGESFDIDVRVTCDGGSEDVYDPFFAIGDSARASLRLFDQAGRYLGNAMPQRKGQGVWLRLSEGTITGRVVQITTAKDSQPEAASDDMRIASVDEGRYFIQLVLFGRYIDVQDANTGKPTLRRGIDSSRVICASNVIEVQSAFGK